MSNPVAQSVNLFGLDRAALEAFVHSHGEPAFRARQLMQWLYQKRVTSFEDMTDVSKSFRARLPGIADVRLPALEAAQLSADGTRKWVLRLESGGAIETVYIPEANRGTLCISSQVGCALDCAFCSTAQQGLQRNLTAAEIVSQVWFAIRTLVDELGKERPISNVCLLYTSPSPRD